MKRFFRNNGLSLVLAAFFLLFWTAQAVMGWKVHDESFQNWQSEFLAVLSIVVLSIFLRQAGSPESKALHSPHSATGK